MSTQKQVAVLVGSLRTGSFTRMVANALADLAPAELKLEIKEIGNLPLYNQDNDEPPPDTMGITPTANKGCGCGSLCNT